MIKRTKTIWLSVLGAVVLMLIVAVVIIWSDESEPDVSDIWPDKIHVLNIKNAYYYFELFSSKEYWGKDDAECGIIKDMAFGEKWDDELARRVVEKNKELYELVEKAARCDMAVAPEPGDMFKEDLSLRVLGFTYLTRLRARLLFRQGEEEKALDNALKDISIGHLIKSSGGGRSQYQKGIMIHARGEGLLLDFLKKTTLSPDVLKKYVSQLLDYPNDTDIWLKTCRAEFAICYNSVKLMSSGRAGIPAARGPLAKYLFKPNRTNRLMAEIYRDFIGKRQGKKLFCEIDVKESSTMVALIGTNKYAPNSLGRVFVCTMSNLSISGDQIWEKRAKHTATAILVALKCYKLEHGELPDSLEDLVPKYLGEVPKDPFDGKPFRYSKEKKILWAAGFDLKDDGGDLESEEHKEKRLSARYVEQYEARDPTFEIEF